MSKSIIDLIFNAVDRASSTTKKIGQEIDGLNSKAGVSTGKAAQLGAAFGAAFLAVQAAAQAAAAAIDFIGTRISEASEAQTAMISTAGTLQSVISIPFKDATKFVDQLNESIFNATNLLPGVTDEYIKLGNSIIDNVVPAAKDLNGVLDKKKLIDLTTSLSQNFGLIGRASKVQQPDVTKGLSRAIGGASLKELEDLMLFTENPALMTKVKEELTKRGVAELKDVDQKSRIDILNAVGGSLISPDTKAALVNTLSARIEGLMGSLFDPSRGIFGFLRRLENRQGKNVLDSVTKAFDGIMAPINKIGEALGKAGVPSTAPLEMLFDFFNFIGDLGNMVADSINVFQLSEGFRWLGDLFNQIGAAFDTIMSGDLSQGLLDMLMLGTMLGDNWGQAIQDWILSIDWGGVLIGLGQITLAVGAFVGSFVLSFGTRLLQTLATLMYKITEEFSYGVSGIVGSIGSTIQAGFNKVAQLFSELIAGFITQAENAAAAAKGVQAGLSAATGGLVPAPSTGSGTGYSGATNIGGDTFYITINTQAGLENANALASDLVKALDEQWTRYKGTRYNNSALAT